MLSLNIEGNLFMISLTMQLKKIVICFFIVSLFIANNCMAKPIKIAFFVNLLSVRGTDVAVYDYADCNETILGNESIIINNTEYLGKPGMEGFLVDCSETTRDKFIKRFGKRFFECGNMEEIDHVLLREKVDIFYVLKSGAKDDKISKICKNAVHAVFTAQIHGDAYACVSQWLSKQYPSLNLAYVPHMVRLENTTDTLHEELNIPHGAVVFGRHGAATTFNLDFAKEAVIEMAQQHKDWYFIFLNTNKFCDLSNVIFLPLTADMTYKTKFINTCDIMLHARSDGETFGLACAEFSIKNKPVITWNQSHERSHIEILGTKGLYYGNKQELLDVLQSCGENIDQIRSGYWDCYSAKYNPTRVMQKFNEVFIQPLINQ